MSLADTKLHLCSCNATMPLDGDALAKALDIEKVPVKTVLCQKQLAQFSDNAAGDVLVACTQEAKLFGDVAEEGGTTQTIRFVNIRETGGWSSEAKSATPKIAALLAMAALPEPDPVPSVAYQSQGQVLIMGPAEAALHWANALSSQLAVTVLMTGRTNGAELSPERAFPVHSGKLDRLSGWLGAFEAAWTQDNPIDLDVCTRLQRLHSRVSGKRHRLELSDRSRALSIAPRVRRGMRRRRGHRFRSHGARRDVADRTLRPGARSGPRSRAGHASAAARLFFAGY